MKFAMMAFSAMCAAALNPQAAFACSDLPNICEQQAQHYREQLDIAATPPWGGDEQNDYQDDWTPTPRYSQQEWAEFIEDARKREAQAQKEAQAAHERRLRDDPAYRQFHEGHWLAMDKDILAKGGSCILHFTRKGQGVLLMGPNGEYNGAFLGFYGPMVPVANRLKTISLSLRQTGEPVQTVQVFNTVTPWAKDMGMVFFAVPSIEAGMAGMTDVLDFELMRGSETLLQIGWHGGIVARDEMRACVAAQRASGGDRRP